MQTNRCSPSSSRLRLSWHLHPGALATHPGRPRTRSPSPSVPRQPELPGNLRNWASAAQSCRWAFPHRTDPQRRAGRSAPAWQPREMTRPLRALGHRVGSGRLPCRGGTEPLVLRTGSEAVYLWGRSTCLFPTGCGSSSPALPVGSGEPFHVAP